MMMTNPSQLQRQASSPEASVWVDASAGTGKTKVLTDRVLRLLLTGTAPSKILCLTFTKAAAAEMQHRIMDRLSSWATLSKADLVPELRDLLGMSPTALDLSKAQHLFFALIDDPYGLKVQTIHGFCQTLLTRFPQEAGIAHTTRILTDHDQKDLMQDVHRSFLSALDVNPEMQKWFHVLCESYKPTYILDALDTLVNNPRQKRWLSSQTLDAFQKGLEALFSMSLTTSAQEIYAKHPLDVEELTSVAAALSEGSKTDQSKAQVVMSLGQSGLNEQTYPGFKDLFLTKANEPRKTFATKKVLTNHPEVGAFFEKGLDRILRLDAQLQSWKSVRMSYALGCLLRTFGECYVHHKNAQKALDYDDLITKSAHLLSLHQGVSWVLYKLDGGIDHILVDEAQDTSPDQWQIILKLAEDFFTGESARSAKRTLFVVGDRKQSIYGFQGAEPDLFAHLRTFFEGKIKAAQQSWTSVSLSQSFRSAPAIMDFVSTVFQDPDLGISEDHGSFHNNAPGRVTIWPLYSEEQSDISGHNGVIPSASQRLAQDIAKDIASRLRNGPSPVTGKAYQPSDFMILVQRRNAFLFQLIRALKKENVPIAGPDRFSLMDHIVTHDLLALASFISYPKDDYALACLLKSPFFGLNDDDLMRMRMGAKTPFLSRLQALYDDEYKRLMGWVEKAKSLSVYDFYYYILKDQKGWSQIRTRFGNDADDVVEEFLMAAKTFDQQTHQSLQSFSEYLKLANVEVKRDFSGSDLNAVRLMTVHGAKGLQAPVVYLPDTVRVPTDRDMVSWVTYGEQTIPIWRGSICQQDDMVADDDELFEYYRLLYVAMTRAESELIVSGFETQREAEDKSWYHCVQRGVANLGIKANAVGQYIYDQFVVNHKIPSSESSNIEPSHALLDSPLPEWALRMPEIKVGDADPLAPSTFLAGMYAHADEKALEDLPEARHDHDAQARHDGIMIHKAIEHLLTCDDEQQTQTLFDEETFQVAKSLCGAPAFQDLKQGVRMTEVSVMGTADVSLLVGSQTCKPTKFSGQIDLLIRDGSQIRIIDFKTGRHVPKSLRACPKVYLAQLYIYGQLLREIYPEATLSYEFIWVRGLQRLTASQSELENSLRQS